MPITRSHSKALKQAESKKSLGEEANKPLRNITNATVKTANCVVKMKRLEAAAKPAIQDSTSILSNILCRVISSKYTNSADRVKMKYPLRCASDIEYCHKNHYRSEGPKMPITSHVNSLLFACNQSTHKTFITLALGMCHRVEFPEGLYTKIIEMILSINPQKEDELILDQIIELFDIAICTFPPCWKALRPAYEDFFRNSLDLSKISVNIRTAPREIFFETIMYLLEHTLNLNEETPQETTEHPPNNSSDFFLDYRQWELNQISSQTFNALPGKSKKLERIFLVLDMIVQILENDITMWILHYHKHPRKWIFCSEEQPLIVGLFKMESQNQMNSMIKTLMKSYAKCLNCSIKLEYLSTLQRYIDLLILITNISEIKHNRDGIHYPKIGLKTKLFIEEFFKILKEFNTNVISFIKTIDMIRIPFFRYEFINIFLQRCGNISIDEMSPMKIATEINEIHWLQFELENGCSKSDTISREQYVKLLLIALRDYCDWHGSKDYFNYDKEDANQSIESISSQRQVEENEFDLDAINKEINQLEKKIDMKTTFTERKIEMPIVHIHVDDQLMHQYRTDMKYLAILFKMVQKQNTLPQAPDFSDWILFLKDFSPAET